MADFDFDLDDLMDFDSSINRIVEQQNRGTSQVTGEHGGLQTSHSQTGSRDGGYSVVSLSDLLQGIPAYDDASNVVTKNEYLQNALLSASLVSEENDTRGSLGSAFDLMIPGDAMASGVDYVESGGGDFSNGGGGGGGGAGAGGGGGATYDNSGSVTAATGAQLMDQHGPSGSGRIVLSAQLEQQFRQGLISNNCLYYVQVLIQHFRVRVASAFRADGSTTGGSGYITRHRWPQPSGPSSPSSGHAANAIDIGDIGDLNGGPWDPLSGRTGMSEKGFDVLNSITGPRRPSVIGPYATGFQGFSTDHHHTGSNGHYHISNDAWGDPLPVPQSRSAHGGGWAQRFNPIMKAAADAQRNQRLR